MKRIILLDDYNQDVREGQIIGSLTTQFGDKAPRHGWKIIEVYETDEDTT